MVRCRLIPTVLIVMAFPPTTLAEDSGVSAGIVQPPANATPPCDTPLCAVLVPHDLWKRDAIPRFNADTLNADAVALDRSRRGELDQRFTETPKLEIRIGKSSCFGTAKIGSVFTGLGDAANLRVLKCGF